MAYQTKEATGSAFYETKSEENPNFPKWTGKLMIKGKLYRVSVWEKESEEEGVPGRLSFALKEWEERPAAPEQTEEEQDAGLFRAPRK